MPERWERELRRLRDVEPSEPDVRQRVWAGPRDSGSQTRRDRAIAGVVAGVVAIAAIALVARTLPAGTGAVGAGDLPALTVSFHDSKVVPEGPDASYRRVETSIAYGDAVDESFTSTTSENAIVDWVAVEDLTRFVPGPTVGSKVRFEADGDDPRVLLGRPDDWPNFGRMERIDRLPDQPGEYLLVFAADYPEGIARTARRVTVVERGTLQLVARHGGEPMAGTAAAFVDGRGRDGYLHTGFFSEPTDATTEPEPEFAADAWLAVDPAPRVVLAGPTAATEAHAGLFDPAAGFAVGDPLPIDVRAGATVDAAAGRHVLVLDVTWEHKGPPGSDNVERALFLFPIEITAPAVETPAPTVEPTPSAPPVTEDVVTIEISRSSPKTGDPEAIARFGDQERWMCPDGWSLVKNDGTTDDVMFDCGQERVFTAPVGVPIRVMGDFSTIEPSARVSGKGVAADVVPDVPDGSVVFLQFAVTWDDGSTASFWLQLTALARPPATTSTVDPAVEAAPALRVRCESYGAEVLTPVVATQVDGVHIEPVDTPSDWEIFLFHEDEPQHVYAAGSSDTDDGFVRPLSEGHASIACIDHEVFTDADMARAESAASPFVVVDPHAFFTPYSPECDPSERETGFWDLDASGADDVAERLREIPGVLDDDVIELAGYDVEWGSRRVWRILRGGRIVAGLWVADRDAAGLSAHGWVCRGSGITGTGSGS